MKHIRSYSREQRRQLERDNQGYPDALMLVPRYNWAHMARDKQIEVWRSRHFLMQVFQEPDGVVRLTVCRTRVDGNDWMVDISWGDLQRLKRECGRGHLDAVEVFPADIDIVNVANLRHLWVLPAQVKFAWRCNGSQS